MSAGHQPQERSATISNLVSVLNQHREHPSATSSANSNASPPSENEHPRPRPAWQGSPAALASLITAARAHHTAAEAELQASSPRILVVGPSGVGKSTLINNMFGIDTAAVRAGGRPLTSTFQEHGPTTGAPVRLIDSRGVERAHSPSVQLDEIISYVQSQRADGQPLEDYVHVAWYLPAARWEAGDARYVRALRRHIPVIIVVSKCDSEARNEIDPRSGIAARFMLRDAVVRDFDDIDVVFCGDQRRRSHSWEPATCPRGHPRTSFEEVNNRKRTWYCGYISGDGTLACPERGGAPGFNALFGYVSLSEVTMDKLPNAVLAAFTHAQRVNAALKNAEAVVIIRTGVLAMTGVATTPIPFSDMPFLLAAEGYMAVRLFALYNVPAAFGDVAFFTAVNTVIVGALGAGAKLVAGFLKTSGAGLPVGVVVDAVVAATAGTAVGIAIAQVSSMWLTASVEMKRGGMKRFRSLVVEAVKAIKVHELLRAMFQLLVFCDEGAVSDLIRVNVAPSPRRS